MVGAVAGCMAALIGVPSAVFLIGPSQERSAGGWVPVGSVDEIPLNQPTLFNTTVAKQRGWVVEQQELSVFVSTQDGTDFVALSDRCTHLACRVRFVDEMEQTAKPGFFCPCHNGVFDASGEIVAGPIPRPLDRFDTKVEEGQLFVKEV
ncbi:MAG: Rieske (2Fe-2S) protein [bacterium]|nr:Rieske (2Fe-2S) protein [bacterium]